MNTHKHNPTHSLVSFRDEYFVKGVLHQKLQCNECGMIVTYYDGGNGWNILDRTKTTKVVDDILTILVKYEAVDVSKGTARLLGVSEATLRRALYILLEDHGFLVYYVPVISKNGLQSNLRVMTRPEITFKDLIDDLNMVHDLKETATMKRERIMKERKRLTTDLTRKIRELKATGRSNVKIAMMLGISESTVRRRLKDAISTEEMLLEAMQSDMIDAREELISSIHENQAFNQIFPELSEKGYILRVHTDTRDAMVDVKKRELKYHLNFTITVMKSEDR